MARYVLVVPAGWGPPADDPIYSSASAVELRRATDGAEPSDRAVAVAKRMEAATMGCEPLVRVFGDVARAGIDKAMFIAKEAPRAAAACGCKMPDLALFEYALLALMGAYDRPVRAIPAAEWLGTR